MKRQWGHLGTLLALTALAVGVLASPASADFPSTFSLSSSFGSSGTGNGQFKELRGIETGASGNIWVADAGNGRIQVFNSGGTYIKQISKGESPLVEPSDVATDAEGNAFVLDRKAARIVKFNASGEFLFEFGAFGTGNGQFNLPSGIALDSKGNIWVSDSANKRIQQFSPEGKYLKQVGKEGKEGGQFTSPQGIAVAPDGSVWVVDAQGEGGRIEKFTSAGTYTEQIANSGQLKEPKGLIVDSANNVWVVDGGHNCVRIFSAKGTQLAQFGGPKESEGSVSSPYDLAFDSNGNPWLAVAGTAKIQKWLAAPEVTTTGASKIKPTTATLNAIVNSRGTETKYQFEYGKTTSYGSTIPLTPKSIGSEAVGVVVSEPITGLTTEVTYHYRITASSTAGKSVGQDVTFVAGEETGEWLVGKAKVTEALLPALTMNLDGGDETMTSKILGVKIEKLCTGAELTGAKLEKEGKISSGTKIKLSGCQIKLNGKVSGACEPRTGAEKGVVVTNSLKGWLVFHEGEGVIRLAPASGSVFMTVQLGEECAIGETIPVGGMLDLQDKSFTTEAKEHLFIKGALKSVWFVSDTAEHQVALSGSAVFSLTGEHSALQWSGQLM